MRISHKSLEIFTYDLEDNSNLEIYVKRVCLFSRELITSKLAPKVNSSLDIRICQRERKGEKEHQGLLLDDVRRTGRRKPEPRAAAPDVARVQGARDRS